MDESEGMTWEEVTAIRDAHVAKQGKEKAEWQAKQAYWIDDELEVPTEKNSKGKTVGDK